MTRVNKLQQAPPYAVEKAIQRLGADLRVARLRRNLTIQEVADKIGTGPRVVADAEKGKISTGICVYMAILWAFDLLDQMEGVAEPAKDEEGQALAISKERGRASHDSGEIDDDF